MQGDLVKAAEELMVILVAKPGDREASLLLSVAKFHDGDRAMALQLSRQVRACVRVMKHPTPPG